MSYCHKCGKESKEEDNFCKHCGAKIKEFLKETEKEAEKIVEKSSHKGIVFFIIFLIIVGYIALDTWAAKQIQPDLSLSSLTNSMSNYQGSAGLTSASASTEIALKNPTFVPVFLFPITYDLSYGSTEIANGKSGVIFILPESESNVPASVDISYTGAGSSLVQGIVDAFTGNTQNLEINFYELGIKVATVTQ